MGIKKVLIGPSSFGAVDDTPLCELQRHDCEIVPNPYGRKLTEDELLELLPGVEGIVAGLETLNRQVLSQSDLKVISRCGIGMDNVDVEAANELGIKVFNTPDEPTLAVAELTVGMMLTLPRQVKTMDMALHEGRWDKRIGMQVYGKKVAIIGFGRIGRKVAELLAPFRAELLIVDPFIEDAQCISIESALSTADIVSLHASGNSTILGDKEFGCMKKGAFVFNAGRGNLINEAALLKALDKGVVSGAWIDTFPNEPYTGPLTGYSQVVLTPHATTYSIQCRKGMELKSVKNLLAGFANDE